MKVKTKAAQCAEQIRKILKKELPETKFKVTSKNYTGGNSVNVDWIDGATKEKVKNLISCYQQGNFNGIEDIYEYNNSRKDIPQTKFLFLNRKISN